MICCTCSQAGPTDTVAASEPDTTTRNQRYPVKGHKVLSCIYFFSGHGLPKASAVFFEKASK